MIGIYVIKKDDAPVYVGQSENIYHRWSTHENKAYPTNEYEFSVLELCSVEILNEREKYWINKMDTYYNGDNRTGKRKLMTKKRERAERDSNRRMWLRNTMKDFICQCGEAELCVMEWYPHHKKIKSLVMRHGARTKQRQQAIEMIENSTPLCQNCAAKYRHGLGAGVI